MVLTDDGVRLVPRAQQVVDAYAAMLDRERDGTKRLPSLRPLRIGMLDEGFGARTVAVLRAFSEARPNFDYTVVPLQRPHREHVLTRNEYDVDVVVCSDPPPDNDDYHVLPAYHEARIAAVPRRSDLAAADHLHVEDVFDLPFCRLDTLTGPMRAIFGLEPERGAPARLSAYECAPEVWPMLDRVALGDFMTFTVGIDAYRHPEVVFVPITNATPVQKRITWRSSAHPAAHAFARVAKAVCGGEAASVETMALT